MSSSEIEVRVIHGVSALLLDSFFSRPDWQEIVWDSSDGAGQHKGNVRVAYTLTTEFSSFRLLESISFNVFNGRHSDVRGCIGRPWVAQDEEPSYKLIMSCSRNNKGAVDARIVEYELLQSEASSSIKLGDEFPKSALEPTRSQYLDLFKERQEIATLLGIEEVRAGNLESSIEDLKLSLLQNSNELELIRNSRSWRYTRYLRGLRSRLRRIFSQKK
jgi:hypothetical protein